MSAPITRYTFEDADGNEFGSFTTLDYAEAKQYAAENRMRVIANEYEWVDSELLEDYTGTADADSDDDTDGDDAEPESAARARRWFTARHTN